MSGTNYLLGCGSCGDVDEGLVASEQKHVEKNKEGVVEGLVKNPFPVPERSLSFLSLSFSIILGWQGLCLTWLRLCR